MGTHPIFESDFDCLTDEKSETVPRLKGGMASHGPRPHISQILNDKHHLEYFKEFLKLNERRLLTLTKEIQKFRSNVQGIDNSIEKTDETDSIRAQLLNSALSNISEITQDSINIAKRTSEELNAEAQRILRSYGDLLANENRAVTNLRKRLESGKVEDSDLANIDEHVQNILDSKIDNYVKSTYYKAFMVEIFTDGELSLDRILSFPECTELFRKFMAQEKSLEVLSFYLLSSDFEARFPQMNSSERQQNAKIIYQKLELIGFSEIVRNEVKKELPKLNHDSFKLPVRQALTTLQTVYLPLFLRSLFFRNYLNQLMLEAGLTGSEGEEIRPKPKSDASSSCSGVDLGASFSRPELIYYRPLSGHLYLGHIDSLGRYRSETLQTGPIQKILAAREKERTKYTLARLIGPSKIDEKTEEEAWKTASLIIADITSFK